MVRTRIERDGWATEAVAAESLPMDCRGMVSGETPKRSGGLRYDLPHSIRLQGER